MAKPKKKSKPAPALLDDMDRPRRERLKTLGWFEAGGVLQGRLMWKRPSDKAIITEEEAFRELERLEAEKNQA